MKHTKNRVIKNVFIVIAFIFVSSCANTPQAKGISVAPQLISSTCPPYYYPEESARLGETGVTMVQVYVGGNGVVTASNIAQSSGFERLDKQAVIYFSKCQFKPGTLDGKPVAAWYTAKYTWKLDEPVPEANAAGSISPNQQFSLSAVNVSSPLSIGWHLEDKSETKVTFTSKQDEGFKVAQVALFDFPPPQNRETLLEIAQSNIAAIVSGGGKYISEPKFESTQLGENPCIKSTFSVQLGVANQGEKPLINQYRVLLCSIPSYVNTGMMIGYSYTSHKLYENLMQEAELFFAGIKVQQKSAK